MDNTTKKVQATCVLGIVKQQNDHFVAGYFSRARIQEDPSNLVPQTTFYKHYHSDMSPRLKSVPQSSSGIMPSANPQIGAPMATFVYGGISPDKPHPQMPLIKGPSGTYTKDNGNIAPYDPPFARTADLGGTIGDGTNLPFYTQLNSSYIVNFQRPQYPTIPSLNTKPFNDANVVTTYNIWGLHNIDPLTDSQVQYVENYGIIWPKGYQGPRIQQVVSQEGTSSLLVTAQNTIAQVERSFPISQDLAYSGANLYYPPVIDSSGKTVNKNSRPIQATGGPNCGFQLHFTHSRVSTMNNSDNNADGGIEIIWGDIKDSTPKKNNWIISQFRISLIPQQGPQLYFYHPRKQKWEFFPIKGPSFGTGDFRVYVHYVGPNMLVGFDADPNGWNCFTPFEDEIDKTTQYKILTPEDSKIKLVFRNITSSFQYGPMAFNNFNPENLIDTHGVESTDPDFDLGRVQFTYTVPSTANGRATDSDANANFQSEQIHISNYDDYTNTAEHTPSVYRDAREVADGYLLSYQQQPGTAVQGDDSGSKPVQVSGEVIFQTTVEGPMFLAFRNEKPKAIPQIPLVQNNLPYSDISQWFESWDITYDTDGDTHSYMTGRAEIVLKNMATDPVGRLILSVMESNTMTVTLGASYDGATSGETFFQGIITDQKTRRTAGGSITTLSCTDIATVMLSEIPFKTAYYFGNMSYRNVIEFCVSSSGLFSWYSFAQTPTSDTGNFDAFNKGINFTLGRQVQDSSSATDFYHVDKSKVPIELIKQILSLCIGGGVTNNTDTSVMSTPELPVFFWDANTGQIRLEWRNNPSFVDTLYFWGNQNGQLPDGLNNGTVHPLHGVLTDEGYTTNVSNKQLHAGIYLLGNNLFNQDFIVFPRNSDPTSPVAFQYAYNDSLLRQDIHSVMTEGYVGFGKIYTKHVSPKDIPDQASIDFYGNQLENFLIHAHEKIEFSCYVAKPLTAYGRFTVSDLVNPYNTTGTYIYDSISYSFHKADNVITANITGIQFPSVVLSKER